MLFQCRAKQRRGRARNTLRERVLPNGSDCSVAAYLMGIYYHIDARERKRNRHKIEKFSRKKNNKMVRNVRKIG